MRIEFYSQFEKQLDKVVNEALKGKVSQVVKQVIEANSLSEIFRRCWSAVVGSFDQQPDNFCPGSVSKLRLFLLVNLCAVAETRSKGEEI